MSGTKTVMLDGDSFQLWYAQSQTEFNLRFSEPDVGKGTSLIKWARGLHSDVAKLATTK